MKTVVLGLTIVLTLLASMAFASPMILGGTGGLLLPNAKTVQGYQLGLGKILDNEGEWNNQMWPATQIEVGVMKNLEVGFTFANDGGSGSTNATTVFNAKYAFNTAGFDLALGAKIGQDDANLIYFAGKGKRYYAAAGKSFGTLDATLSLNVIDPDDAATVLYPGLLFEKKLESGTVIGIEVVFGPKDNPIYRHFDGNRQGTAYVEVPVDKQLSVKGGIIGIGDSNDENGFWLGGTYTFGKNITDK